MLEIRPTLNLLATFCSAGLASLNAGQRWTDYGRKPERDGSRSQPISLAIRTAVRRSTSA